MRRFRVLLLGGLAAGLIAFGGIVFTGPAAIARIVPPPGGGTGSPPGASTGLPANVDVLSNDYTFDCLSDHSGVVTHDPCPNDPSAANRRLLWQRQPVKGGVMLRNLGTNRCLVGSSIRIGQGDRVFTLPCGGDGHKLWSVRSGDGGDVFQNLAYRRPMCLDDTVDQKVTLQPCVSHDDHQGWFAP